MKVFERIAAALVSSFWTVAALAFVWLALVLAEVFRPDYQL
jgi:hypothetical protein